MKVKAHEVASEPDLYYKAYRIGSRKYDCGGYSKGGDGKTIMFTCLEPVSTSKDGFVFNLHVRYLQPDQMVEMVEENE